MPGRQPPIRWDELFVQRPLEPATPERWLRTWAADQRSPHIVLEARGSAGGVSYLLGTAPGVRRQVVAALLAAGTTLVPCEEPRPDVRLTYRLHASTRHRPLRSDDLLGVVRAILSALAQARSGEQLVLQLMLGPRRVPLAVSQHSPSSLVAPWYSVAWHGNGRQIDGEKRAALRAKVADHGFACTVRLGAYAATRDRERALILALLAAIRTSEAAGLRLTLRPERAAQLNGAGAPWRWPLRLGVPELIALTAYPLGEDDLPGVPSLHPIPLPPPAGTTGTHRVIATASAPGSDGQRLAISVEAALRHVHVIGPTGTGKSTLLGRLIAQDIADGRGVMVVEPRGDVVDDVMARVPEERLRDIVNVDPLDPAPVGLNPLSAAGRRPELVADAVLAIFKGLYGSAVGPRSQDILYAGLLTLAQHRDASLVMLPLLLTNAGFRRSLTAGLRDPLSLEPFWAAFEGWSEAERAMAVAPVMNKLRPLLRPGLRGVLGQRAPRFDLRQVFEGRKVLLVPLRRGVIGPEAARLLGSLVMAELWHVIQARSAVAPARRHPVMIYIDEVQDYLHLPTDLGEALAQARGYGASFTVAHQFLDQLPTEMRAAVLTNARTRVAFQVSPEDATRLAKGHPELTPLDLSSLGEHAIYASIFAGGQSTPYASGVTLAPEPATTDPERVRALSRERYGRPLDEVEAEFVRLARGESDKPLGATGRRRRSAS